MFSKKFIAATKEYCTRERFVSAPLFRRKFTYTSGKKAELYLCGLGFYELFINGRKITHSKLAPFMTNVDVRCVYDYYNITEHLTDGENVLGVMLGNGYLNCLGGDTWDLDKAEFRSAPKLALAMLMDDELAFEADQDFRCAESAIYFDDLRLGEYYDARKYQKDWCTVALDDTAWHPVLSAETPKGEAVLNRTPPIRCTAEVPTKAFWKIELGYLFDFGENLAGVCRLKIKGNPGQKLIISHGELLTEGRMLYTRNIRNPRDYSPVQVDIYICSGGEEPEIYEPSFTYHGFRYVYIEGVQDEQVTADLLTMQVWHTDFPAYSTLETDNAIVNRLQRMTMNSNLSNFLHIVTDCPQREKNGWVGDAQTSAEQMLYNFDCSASLREYLHNLRAMQREDGNLPVIYPTTGWGYDCYNGPCQTHIIAEMPYQLYRFTGNKQIIAENAQAIKRSIQYILSRKNADGLFDYGLPAEWGECLTPAENICSTPAEITDTYSCIAIFRKAALLLREIGDTQWAEYCDTQAQQTVCAFRKKHLRKDLYISCRSQTAQAIALLMDIFTLEEHETAVKNLLTLIEESGHFRIGVAGSKSLFRALSDNGHQDLALHLMTQSGKMSYKHWIDQGMTTLGENMYETYPGSIFRKDGGRILSQNHHMFGAISGWFYRYIAGLQVNPDWKNPHAILIKPCLFREIGYVKASYNRDGKQLEWEVRKVADKLEVTVLKNTGFDLTVIV